MGEGLEYPSVLVILMKKKMELYVTTNVMTDTTELVQSAGKTAQKALEMMELSVASHLHMEEELDTLYGTRANARRSMMKVVRSTERIRS